MFKLDPAGNETVLYSFTGGADGGRSNGGLVRDAGGNLYGAAVYGTYGFGVVFKLDPAGNETVLYSFTGGADGGDPKWDLARDLAGNLYGTTGQGGTTNFGVVYKLNPAVGTLMPADFDGTIAPPPGEPNALLSIGANAPGNSLSLFKFHVDFSNPANSTFTGPTTIRVKSFNEACGGEGTCVPQAGTSQQLDSLGDRLMFRLAYRNFGDHESLVVNHSVAPGISGIVAGVRWYEIRNPNGKPTVYQQGTFASKTRLLDGLSRHG